MTSALEKQFFDTFELEPKYHCSYHDCNCPIEDVGKFNKACPRQAVTKECDARSHKAMYPQITDRILLELVCVHNTYLEINLYSLDYKSLKEEILKDLIDEQESRELKKDYVSDDMKQQVQALFKE